MNHKIEREAVDAIIKIDDSNDDQNLYSIAKLFDDIFATFSSTVNKELMPHSIEPSYTGIHLKNNYEESDFMKMVESFRNGQILHAKYAIQLLNSAIKIYEKYPNISSCNLRNYKDKTSGCVVVGDLHGSFKDLSYLIHKFGIPGKNYCFIFNGDFVDRGPQQCEVLLTLIYAFLLYPTRVFLNRGNHEDLRVNFLKGGQPHFIKDTQLKYNKYSTAVYNKAQELFKNLPLATVVENNSGFRCFVVHGGISNRLDLDYIASANLQRNKFPTVSHVNTSTPELKKMSEQIIDLLWSDPIKPGKSTKLGFMHDYNLKGSIPNTNRGVGCFFGHNVTTSFCRKYNFNAIIRSHEVRATGISLDHPKCFTIFSCSNYCGNNNKGAVIIIGTEEKRIKHHMYTAHSICKSSFTHHKERVISNFKAFLNKEFLELSKKLFHADTTKNGWLTLNTWSNILSNFILAKKGIRIEPRHFVALKNYLCPCNNKLGTIQYKLMFNHISSVNQQHVSAKLNDYLESVFNLLDHDHNGYISRPEAEDSFKLVNNFLGTRYNGDYIYNLDANQDGRVDLHDFKMSFSKSNKLISS